MIGIATLNVLTSGVSATTAALGRRVLHGYLVRFAPAAILPGLVESVLCPVYRRLAADLAALVVSYDEIGQRLEASMSQAADGQSRKIDPHYGMNDSLEAAKENLLASIARLDQTLAVISPKLVKLRAEVVSCRGVCVDAYEAANAIQWKIGEHDADLDDVLPGQFTSARELIESLRA